MRWKDEEGIRWRVRQTRLGWKKVVRPGKAAAEVGPSGVTGADDPISALIALIVSIPLLLVLAVMLPLWLLELTLRLAAAPFMVLLRLGGVLPYRLELRRNGETAAVYLPVGRDARSGVRAALRAGEGVTLPQIDRPSSRTQRVGLGEGGVWWRKLER